MRAERFPQVCCAHCGREIPRRMRCFVYKSLRKADTYVYLGQREDFARLPEPLRGSLGELSFVMEFELDAGRALAREDARVVRENLVQCGFHLQFPPPVDTNPWRVPHRGKSA